MWKHGRSVYIFGRCIQENLLVTLDHASNNHVSLQQVRHIKKHWDPKFKKQRAAKFQRPSKDQFSYMDDMYKMNVSQENMRAKLKKLNIRTDLEAPDTYYYNSSSNVILDPYQPPGGDGKFSFTKDQAINQLQKVRQPLRRIMNLKKIKRYDTDFDKRQFLTQAVEIYTKAHELLTGQNKEGLIDYVTPSVYGMMLENTKRKTIVWKYLGSLEPPTIVHVSFINMDDMTAFGQITIRLHSEQQLAVYDRFGRLIQGSEILRKDVLEYVVFEKNLLNEYGSWRIAGKIKPKPLPPVDPIIRTYVVSPENTDKIKSDKPTVHADPNIVHQTEKSVERTV